MLLGCQTTRKQNVVTNRYSLWYDLSSCEDVRFQQYAVTFMCSSGRGNATSAAEFNFYADPEAAYVVLNELHVPITMTCWELCLNNSISLVSHVCVCGVWCVWCVVCVLKCFCLFVQRFMCVVFAVCAEQTLSTPPPSSFKAKIHFCICVAIAMDTHKWSHWTRLSSITI